MPTKARKAKQPALRGQKRGKPRRPPVPFDVFADTIQLLNLVMGDELESVGAGDLGCFIENKGTAADNAEAVLALMPVMHRVADRHYAKQ